LVVAIALAGQVLLAKAGKTHRVAAEFVSSDAMAKTITVKGDNGQTQTIPLQGSAVSAVKHLKAGQHLELTCLDNEKGEHQAITAITTARAKK